MNPTPEMIEAAAKSIATMVTEYVEGGIKGETDWRNGLESIIAKRLSRFAAPLRLAVKATEKEMILLRIIEASGGNCDSSESKWSWLNWFCNDETEVGGSDTFNRCNDKGWLHTTHNSDWDVSTTTLTELGRSALSSPVGRMEKPAHTTSPFKTRQQHQDTDAAIRLGAAVLARIEDVAVREIAIRNALTAAAGDASYPGSITPGVLTATAEDHNTAFDPADEAFGGAFRDGFREGWLFAKSPDFEDRQEAEEDYTREVDMAPTECWDAYRSHYFAKLPLAAIPQVGSVISPTPSSDIAALREGLERIAEASPRSTNSWSAEEAFSWCAAVAETALENAALQHVAKGERG